MFKQLQPVTTLPVNLELKTRFVERLKCIQNDVLRKTGQELCRLVGDWLFQCQGTSPEAPGTKHHTQYGGLAEHLLGVEHLCMNLSHNIPFEADISLLRFVALFHDIGKCYEFAENGKSPYVSLGHVAIGLMLVPQLLESLGGSETQIFAVSHCIASHHGRLNEGALAEPDTCEAQILAAADRLDAKLWHTKQTGENHGLAL